MQCLKTFYRSLVGRVSMTDSSREPAPVPASQIPRRVSYQPLHPSVRPALDPEYVSFHDKYVQYVEPEHLKPWTPALRTRYTWPYSGSEVVSVGSVQDVRLGDEFNVRIFTPATNRPAAGWPLLIWFHGGGFCVGNIESDSDLCSRACQRLGCMVVNVDYRLAPENPFPAAVEDVGNVLLWVQDEVTGHSFGFDRSRIVIGGASAGGNLAAVGALMAAELDIGLLSQLLVAPVIDSTATLDSSWSCRPHAPWLTAARMAWYRDLYLQGHDARDWKVSPIFAPENLLIKLPKTYLFVPEQDMLYAEALAYGDSLQNAGVEVHARKYAGMPHSMMALSGALKTGLRSMNDVIEALRESLLICE